MKGNDRGVTFAEKTKLNDRLLKPHIILMKVTAPNGLKILDAPHFQVNNLIRGQNNATSMPFMKSYKSLSSDNRSTTASKASSGNASVTMNPSSIFQTMHGSFQSDLGRARSWEVDASGKKRVLPRGALFEASKRMERAGAFSHGSGLIKLADDTGWAIVPIREELLEQYKTYQGGNASIGETESSRGYEEVGNAFIVSDHKNLENNDDIDTSWVRIIHSAGVQVSCCPTKKAEEQSSKLTQLALAKTLTLDSSFSKPQQDSDAVSTVSSVFGVFRSSKKQEVRDDHTPSNNTNRKRSGNKSRIGKNRMNLIPCGICVQVEHWIASKSHPERQSFVRLCGGQGWIPRMIGGSQYLIDIRPPDIRQGSFWFRVQSVNGMNVRTGPSQRARPIKSSDDVCFRFECGEFLRASEILTIHGHADIEENEDNGEEIPHPSESFAKLYRNKSSKGKKSNQTDDVIQSNNIKNEVVQLSSLTAPGEWVHVHCNGNLYLEECVNSPTIRRNRDGWRYEVLIESGIAIRKGPSFLAKLAGEALQCNESVLINEQVHADGDTITWMRLKDGRGWIHNMDEDGKDIVVEKMLKKAGGNDASYKLIARLFNPPDATK